MELFLMYIRFELSVTYMKDLVYNICSKTLWKKLKTTLKQRWKTSFKCNEEVPQKHWNKLTLIDLFDHGEVGLMHNCMVNLFKGLCPIYIHSSCGDLGWETMQISLNHSANLRGRKLQDLCNIQCRWYTSYSVVKKVWSTQYIIYSVVNIVTICR